MRGIRLQTVKRTLNRYYDDVSVSDKELINKILNTLYKSSKSKNGN